MHSPYKYFIAFLGLVCIAIAVWQWLAKDGENISAAVSETGLVSWLLPGKMRRLGSGQHYREPRRVMMFEIRVDYPAYINTDQGFQIVLESTSLRGEHINPDTGELHTLGRADSRGYHVFALELPGLESSPVGNNQLAVDGKVRWQVAPPREAGVYKGYIRADATSGTGAIRGAEQEIRWKNPGDFELEVTARRSFAYLDHIESLVLGFLGSLLSFPALWMLYKAIRSRSDSPD